MSMPNVRSWTRAEFHETRGCDECGAALPKPVMTDTGETLEGSGWTHDRLPNGQSAWFHPCPSCGHRNYFDLGDTDE